VSGAVGAVVGGAAIGVARLVDRRSRPKVLGVAIPDELLGHVDVKRLAKDVDVKDIIRKVGNFAEHVEARSEDLRTLSAQAKRLSRRIG
jgi:hypothetical protein